MKPRKGQGKVKKVTFMHLFNKFILSTYDVPGCVLSPGDTAVNRKYKIPCLCNADMLRNLDFIL